MSPETTGTNPLTRTVDGRLAPAVGTWLFEAGNSSVAFVVRHLMISKVRGAIREFSGAIVVAEDPRDSVVTVTMAAGSIETGMAARDADLRGKDFLNAEAHPEMTFASRRVEPSGSDWKLHGDLVIAGTARAVVLAMEFNGAASDAWGNSKAVFSASAEIDREEWGLTYNQALETGGVLIGSKVKIEIEIQAKRQEKANG